MKMSEFAKGYKIPMEMLKQAFSSESVFSSLENVFGPKVLAEMVKSAMPITKKANAVKNEKSGLKAQKDWRFRILDRIRDLRAVLGPIAKAVKTNTKADYSAVRRASMLLKRGIPRKRQISNFGYLAELSEAIKEEIRQLEGNIASGSPRRASIREDTAIFEEKTIWQRYDRQNDESVETAVYNLNPVFAETLEHLNGIMAEENEESEKTARNYKPLGKLRFPNKNKFRAYMEWFPEKNEAFRPEWPNDLWLIRIMPSPSQWALKNEDFCPIGEDREIGKPDFYRGHVWLSIGQLRTIKSVMGLNGVKYADYYVRVNFPIVKAQNVNFTLEAFLSGKGIKMPRIRFENAELGKYNSRKMFPSKIWDTAVRSGEELAERLMTRPENTRMLGEAVKGLKLAQMKYSVLCYVRVPISVMEMLGHVLTAKVIPFKTRVSEEMAQEAKEIAEINAEALRGYVVDWIYPSGAIASQDVWNHGKYQYLAYFPSSLISSAEDKNRVRRSAKTGMLDAQIRNFLFICRSLGEKSEKVYNKATSHKINFADYGIRYPVDFSRRICMLASIEHRKALHALKLDLAYSSELSSDSEPSQVVYAMLSSGSEQIRQLVRSGRFSEALIKAEKEGIVRLRHSVNVVPLTARISEDLLRNAVSDKEHVFFVRDNRSPKMALVVIDGFVSDSDSALSEIRPKGQIWRVRNGIPILKRKIRNMDAYNLFYVKEINWNAESGHWDIEYARYGKLIGEKLFK